MKHRHLFLGLLLPVAVSAFGQVPAAPPLATPIQQPVTQPLDPTQANPRVHAALAEGTGLSAIGLKGMVIGPSQSGTVLLDLKGQGSVLARPRVPFTATIDGTPRKLIVKSISSEGVEIEAPLQAETVTIPSYGGEIRLPAGSGINVLPYVDFRDVPLLDALRMLADQSGQNYSASAAANKTLINALLRNLSAANVVEEICKSHNLYFKRDEVTNIIRVLTVDEFQRDLIGFREEQTEVFTLKFPNVFDVALAISDLYGDRVRLSLGTEYQDEDTEDLETRFDRFDVVNRRGQLTSGTGNNVNGNGSSTTFAGSGENGFSFGSNGRSSGYGSSRNSNSSNRQNTSERRRATNSTEENLQNQFQGLTPEQAQRLARALARNGSGDGDATIESLRARPAHIYVTANRRNSIVGVRSADKGAMDEIRKLVHRLDVRTPMVLLEVKVLSVDLGDDLRTVFDYDFNNGHVAGSFTTGGGIELPNPGFSAGLRSSDMTFTVVSNNFRARIQALEEKRRVKSLATPLLLTANNEVSRLFLGEERPLIRNVSSQTIITDRNVATTPNTTVEFRNVGNTLLITPNINSDRTVTLRLLQENSFISPNQAQLPVVTNNANGGSSGVQNVGVDVVATRTISGTFVAKDNLAVAIGGLIEDSTNDVRAGVPLVGRIPVVGFFFRRTEKTKNRKELIIMIRPHIISTPADSQAISQDVLHNLAAPDSQRLLQEGLWPTDQPLPPLPASPAGTKPAATPVTVTKVRTVVERKEVVVPKRPASR